MRQKLGRRIGYIFLLCILSESPALWGMDDSSQQEILEPFVTGFRAGISDSHNEQDFSSYELFFNSRLPWSWHVSSRWYIGTQIEIMAALLRARTTSGFIGSAGPVLYLKKHGGRLTVHGGVAPAYLSEDRYGEDDLSGHFQVMTQAGLRYHIALDLSAAYVFQHMSNADLEQPNPGLNLHMIEVSYSF